MKHFKIRVGKKLEEEASEYIDNLINNSVFHDKIADNISDKVTYLKFKVFFIRSYILEHSGDGLDYSKLFDIHFEKLYQDGKDNNIFHFLADPTNIVKNFIEVKSLDLLEQILKTIQIKDVVEKNIHSMKYYEFELKQENLNFLLHQFDSSNLIKIIEAPESFSNFSIELLKLGKYSLPWINIYNDEKYFNKLYELFNDNVINYQYLFKYCHGMSFELLFKLKPFIIKRLQYINYVSAHPNIPERTILKEIKFFNKEILSRSESVTNCKEILSKYVHILDKNALSKNPFLTYENLIDLAFYFSNSYDPNDNDRSDTRMNYGYIFYREFDWKNILINANFTWGINNIRPFLNLFNGVYGSYEIVANNTDDIFLIKSLMGRIRFEDFAMTNDKFTWDLELLEQFLNENRSMSRENSSEMFSVSSNIADLISFIKIDQVALITLKSFWKKCYLYTRTKYKRGDSFSYFKGTFPLYKKLYQNKNLDKQFLIEHIIPSEINIKFLESSDNDMKYLVEY